MSNFDEIVLRKSQQLQLISDADRNLMFRTKDIYLVAFITSRGFQWFGAEEVEVSQVGKNRFQKNVSKRNRFIFFYFKDTEAVRTLSLNYYNGTSLNLNVNASIFVQNILTVRSIITDPPF